MIKNVKTCKISMITTQKINFNYVLKLIRFNIIKYYLSVSLIPMYISRHYFIKLCWSLQTKKVFSIN